MKKILLILCVFFLSGCASLIKLNNIRINERREQYILSHPELDNTIKKNIMDGSINIGMTKEEVIASWGKPSDIHRTVGSWGCHEQWVYGYWNGNTVEPHNYLYFENGILTSWQD